MTLSSEIEFWHRTKSNFRDRIPPGQPTDDRIQQHHDTGAHGHVDLQGRTFAITSDN